MYSCNTGRRIAAPIDRAIAIEDNAQENLVKVKGLGRDYSWKSYTEWEDSQFSFCQFYEENDIPCSCYDG